MSFYISIIKESFAFFPIIAAVFTLPYLIYNYHKYGSVWSIRILIVYSFILYVMTVLFLTSLPLPSRESVANLNIPRYNLHPFAFVKDIMEEAPMISDDPTTWIYLLKAKAFKEFAANILMCIPFGMYMRYYFRQNFFVSVLLTFLFSLFLELSQLTGLWFIYPRNYRMFDVDDLMSNTLGGLIGYLIMVPLGYLLPSRKRIDEASYRKGEKVSLLRRLMALGTDLVIFGFLTIVAGFYFPVSHMRFLAYFLIVSIAGSLLSCLMFRGKTPGMALMSLRIVNPEHHRASLISLLIRFVSEYGFMIGIPLIIDLIEHKFAEYSNLLPVLQWGYILGWLVSMILFLASRRSLFAWLSNTELVSDIRLRNENLQ